MNTPRSLAGRELALALLTGAIGSGADMGHEMSDRDAASAFAPRGSSFGAEGFGFDYGRGPGGFAGDPAPSDGRQGLLYPNANSLAKIQKYVFAVNQTVVQQTAQAIAATQNPQTQIRPQRVTCNAPQEGWGTLTNIQLANVNVLVGGVVDMFDFSARAMDSQMDLPTLSPANAVQVAGAYSGLLSPGYPAGANYIWALSLKGPSNMVA